MTVSWMQRRVKSTAIVAASAFSLCVAAAEPPIVVKKLTAAGQEVIVRGFAEFDAACNLKHVQTIVVTVRPDHGEVETRPGAVVIGPNWVGGGHCEGTTLRGVNVFYVPAQGFTGTDRFSLEVGYSSGRKVRAEVGVEVTARAGARRAPS